MPPLEGSLWRAAYEVALPFSSQRVGPGPKLSQPDSPPWELDSSFSLVRLENELEQSNTNVDALRCCVSSQNISLSSDLNITTVTDEEPGTISITIPVVVKVTCTQQL